jgi:hypothetical protein
MINLFIHMPPCDKNQYSLVTLQLLHDSITAEVIYSINNLTYLTLHVMLKWLVSFHGAKGNYNVEMSI